MYLASKIANRRRCAVDVDIDVTETDEIDERVKLLKEEPKACEGEAESEEEEENWLCLSSVRGDDAGLTNSKSYSAAFDSSNLIDDSSSVTPICFDISGNRCTMSDEKKSSKAKVIQTQRRRRADLNLEGKGFAKLGELSTATNGESDD